MMVADLPLRVPGRPLLPTGRPLGMPARVRWLALAALAVAALATGCAGAEPGGSRPQPGAALRVITYNIHHGVGLDGRLDLQRLAGVIVRERPDVVALQEVDRGVERSGQRDLLRELAELTGLEHAAFGKNLDHQGGDYGNGLLSRFPIRRQANLHLDQLGPGERRGVLHAVLDVEGREVAVLVTHLDHLSLEERLASVRQIEERLLPAYERYPLVLAGDINDVPEGAVYRRLTARLADAWVAGEGLGYTIPVGAPARRIDYVFHSRHLVPVAAHVPWSDASDHLPVVADLRFAD
jgi:endonuclease/exonuclease/phosphatase family metal-dependent hydrolase